MFSSFPETDVNLFSAPTYISGSYSAIYNDDQFSPLCFTSSGSYASIRSY